MHMLPLLPLLPFIPIMTVIAVLGIDPPKAVDTQSLAFPCGVFPCVLCAGPCSGLAHRRRPVPRATGLSVCTWYVTFCYAVGSRRDSQCREAHSAGQEHHGTDAMVAQGVPIVRKGTALRDTPLHGSRAGLTPRLPCWPSDGVAFGSSFAV